MPAGEGVRPDLTDAEVRKLRSQTGLDTLVVFAVNDERWGLESGAHSNNC